MILSDSPNAVETLAALREAFSQHPDWRGYDEHQLAVLLFLGSYCTFPPDEGDIASALPFALADRDPDGFGLGGAA